MVYVKEQRVLKKEAPEKQKKKPVKTKKTGR